MSIDQVIELLAMAIDGTGDKRDMPDTEKLLWAYFNACADAGAEDALSALDESA